MSETRDAHRQEVALFRYGLIADLLHLPRGSREIGLRLQEKARRSYAIPRSQRCAVAAETLRHWLKLYRSGGFEALKPRGRRDAGESHALPREVADLLCHLKEEHPELSVPLIIKKVQASGQVPDTQLLPQSTVYRLFSRTGLMRKAEQPSKDHRRFSFEHANDLWMSDVMHGPSVGVGGKVRRKAYLIAFIDDATRVVPFAAFALAENTAAFFPQLKQAIMRRGVPKRLYVDNGSAYRSKQLQLLCAILGITLIHTRPYHPEAKGKQERWFRTARMQLLPALSPSDTTSLDALNRRLWAWVEGEYHRTPHRGLDGLTPLDAWAQKAVQVNHLGHNQDLDQMFMFEQRRKVAKDRTVSLLSTVYEVDAILVGSTVILRYDPARPGAPVQVWTPDGHRHGDGKPVDVHVNRLAKRATPPAPAQDVHASTLRLSELQPDSRDQEGR